MLLVVLIVLARPPQAADCATQRNLTDAGHDDARRVGAALKARGVSATCSD